MPSISVIVPAYNAERTILKTIQSILQQTFQDFELIVIDDGSQDRTLERLETVRDERLKIFSYDNGGNALARNRGIALATGEFLSFIDADDLWTSDKLESQLIALQQHPEAGVAYSWTSYFIDGQEESIFPYHPVFFTGNVYDKLLVNNFIASGSNILVRKEAVESIEGFDSTLKRCVDWDFYISLSARWQFVMVPKHQIFYRQSPISLSSNVEIMEQQALKVIEKAYRSAPSEYQFLKAQSLAWIYQYCTQQYLKYSNDFNGVVKASQKLWVAVSWHPQILLEDYARNLIQWLIKKWILTLLGQGLVAKNKLVLLIGKD